MEYGIWSLHVAGELWGDPRLARRHPILPSGATQILPRAAFALSALHRPDMLPLPLTAAGPPYVPMELVTKPASIASTNAEDAEDAEKSTNGEDEDPPQRDDNEGNIEKADQNENQTCVPNESNDNEDAGDESDTGSTNSSHRSANNNLSIAKLPDPMACLALDKEGTPVLNGWVLGAYTAMLGRLSAATAALEATEVPNIPSDSDSESEHSSYTEKSRGSSPNVSSVHRGYSCGSCDVVAPTRPALRKHIADCHPALSGTETGETKRCPSTGCDFTTSSRCEMETHVAAHVAQGMTPTGKKRSLALQRVRYRYEREEYRCSLCSYACTIEKAFQRHLRAHARGTAPETRVSCAVCGADRSSEVDLSRHMRRHRDDRYFCCDICIFRTVQLQPAWHVNNSLAVGLLEGYHRCRPGTEPGILAVLKSGRDQLAKTPPKNEEKSNGPERPAGKEIWDSPVLYTSSFCQYCDLDILEFTGRLVQVLNLADKRRRIAMR